MSYQVTNLTTMTLEIGGVLLRGPTTLPVPDTARAEVLDAYTRGYISYTFSPDTPADALDTAAVTRVQSGITNVTLATLPTITPATAKRLYSVTDENGGTLYESNGLSLVKRAPGLTEYDIISCLWAERGVGNLGQVKRILDFGNNFLTRAEWNGTRWTPFLGCVLVYDLPAPIVSTSTTTPSITLPNITLPPGSWGLSGGFEIELVGDCTTQTPTARTVTMTLDGAQIINDTTAQRHFGFQRGMVNNGVTNSQTVFEKSNDYGRYLSANQTVQTKSKDTTLPLVLAGSVSMTLPSADVLTLWKLRVWWIGQGA